MSLRGPQDDALWATGMRVTGPEPLQKRTSPSSADTGDRVKRSVRVAVAPHRLMSEELLSLRLGALFQEVLELPHWMK